MKKTLFNLLFAVAIAVCCPGCGSDGGVEAFDKGMKEFMDGNYTRAVEWLQEAAGKGHAEARTQLGVCYRDGHGVERDAVQAVKWFRKAAEQDNCRACLSLGTCYYQGEGVAEDKKLAIHWLEKAVANAGDDKMLLFLAQSTLEAILVEDTPTPKELYKQGREAAAKGDAAGAAKLYREAAEQEYTAAESMLGWCYRSGTGVAADPAVAATWFHKAAAKGEVSAQMELGAYYQSIGNTPASLYWVGKALKSGNLDATRYGMAVEIVTGLKRSAAPPAGVPEWFEKGCAGIASDPAGSVEWFRKVADAGDARGQYMLGVCYHQGQGVAVDIAQAMKWYQEAADQGHTLSQLALGMLYYVGQGVKQDVAVGRRWIDQAVNSGNLPDLVLEMAEKLIETVESATL
jgi:TPR repeat protein